MIRTRVHGKQTSYLPCRPYGRPARRRCALQQDYDLTASDNRLPGLFLRLRNCFRLQRKTSDDHQKISPLIMELRFFSTLGSRSPRISLLLMPFVLQMMLIISSGSKPTSLFEILTVLPLMMVLVI